MTRRFFFFATKRDLLEILTEMEKTKKVQYIENKIYDKQKYTIHKSIIEFKDLGINKTGDHNSPMYLVIGSTDSIISEAVRQSGTGETKYFINSSDNKGSINFNPGGFYGNEYLIHGQVTTLNYADKKAEELYKIFKKAFSKKCKKIKNWHFGKEALSIAKDVRLITVGIKQPKTNDFTID
jgi:hypothetical protein